MKLINTEEYKSMHTHYKFITIALIVNTLQDNLKIMKNIDLRI